MTITRLDEASLDDLDALYTHPAGAGRPWVRLSFVTSLDGSVTSAAGTSGDLGGPADRAAYTAMRNACDVVLVGAGTVRDEGYGPISPDDVDTARRICTGLAPVPALAIATAGLSVPTTPLGPGTVVVTTRAAAATRPVDAELLTAGENDVDWSEVLRQFTERGWHRVLCEGGPHLAAALARADLVDELCLTLSPELVGGDGPRLTTGAPGLDRPMELAHLVAVGDVLLTRWLRRRAS